MPACPWTDWDPATIAFCEERLCAWIREPSNTWSNLAFVIAGLIMLRDSRRRRGFAFGPLFVYATLFLGWGSFMFHMTATFFFETFDLLGMFLISGLMVVINWHRLRPTSPALLQALFVGMTAISLAVMMFWRSAGIPIFALQITIALTLEIFCHLRDETVRYRMALWTIATFAVSFTIWRLDVRGVLCIPENHLITGHAVWHCLNAVAIYFIYRFYRDNEKQIG